MLAWIVTADGIPWATTDDYYHLRRLVGLVQVACPLAHVRTWCVDEQGAVLARSAPR